MVKVRQLVGYSLVFLIDSGDALLRVHRADWAEAQEIVKEIKEYKTVAKKDQNATKAAAIFLEKKIRLVQNQNEYLEKHHQHLERMCQGGYALAGVFWFLVRMVKSAFTQGKVEIGKTKEAEKKRNEILQRAKAELLEKGSISTSTKTQLDSLTHRMSSVSLANRQQKDILDLAVDTFVENEMPDFLAAFPSEIQPNDPDHRAARQLTIKNSWTNFQDQCNLLMSPDQKATTGDHMVSLVVTVQDLTKQRFMLLTPVVDMALSTRKVQRALRVLDQFELARHEERWATQTKNRQKLKEAKKLKKEKKVAALSGDLDKLADQIAYEMLTGSSTLMVTEQAHEVTEAILESAGSEWRSMFKEVIKDDEIQNLFGHLSLLGQEIRFNTSSAYGNRHFRVGQDSTLSRAKGVELMHKIEQQKRIVNASIAC